MLEGSCVSLASALNTIEDTLGKSQTQKNGTIVYFEGL